MLCGLKFCSTQIDPSTIQIYAYLYKLVVIEHYSMLNLLGRLLYSVHLDDIRHCKKISPYYPQFCFQLRRHHSQPWAILDNSLVFLQETFSIENEQRRPSCEKWLFYRNYSLVLENSGFVSAALRTVVSPPGQSSVELLKPRGTLCLIWNHVPLVLKV